MPLPELRPRQLRVQPRDAVRVPLRPGLRLRAALRVQRLCLLQPQGVNALGERGGALRAPRSAGWYGR